MKQGDPQYQVYIYTFLLLGRRVQFQSSFWRHLGGPKGERLTLFNISVPEPCVSFTIKVIWGKPAEKPDQPRHYVGIHWGRTEVICQVAYSCCSWFLINAWIYMQNENVCFVKVIRKVIFLRLLLSDCELNILINLKKKKTLTRNLFFLGTPPSDFSIPA